jgi:transcriptional regulator
MAMELLHRHGGMNGREIGDLMGVDYSALSVVRKRLRELLASDKNVLRLMKKIEDRLS